MFVPFENILSQLEAPLKVVQGPLASSGPLVEIENYFLSVDSFHVKMFFYFILLLPVSVGVKCIMGNAFVTLMFF